MASMTIMLMVQGVTLQLQGIGLDSIWLHRGRRTRLHVHIIVSSVLLQQCGKYVTRSPCSRVLLAMAGNGLGFDMCRRESPVAGEDSMWEACGWQACA